jgi:hypothetical protein
MNRKIFGEIIALTKEIKFQQPQVGAALLEHFPRPSQLFGMVAGVGQWWYTENALQHCENITSMAISSDSRLKEGDRESLCAVIRLGLQENAWNHEVFNASSFFSKHFPTLFDARAIPNVDDFR